MVLQKKRDVLRPILATLLLFSLVAGLFFGEVVVDKYGKAITIGMVGVAYAVAPDYIVDGVDDNVQVQQALDALPAAGGKLKLLGATYDFSATVTRAIGEVTIEGMGLATLINNNGAANLFSDGGQNNWLILNLGTDAGGFSLTGTDSQAQNVWIGGTFYTIWSGTTGTGTVVIPDDSIDDSELWTTTSNAANAVGVDDLIQGAVQANEGIVWDGANWVPANITGGGNGTDIYYGVMNVPFGTNPFATGANETLNWISDDIDITGTAGNDTMALALATDSVRDNELAASSDNSGTTVSITDFLTGAPGLNQIPKWDGSDWAPAADGGGGNGTDIYWGVIDVSTGTDPFVVGANETLSFISDDLTITGTAGNDTIAFAYAANSIVLGADTTGAYVATVTDSGSATITVVGSGGEGAAVTLNAVNVDCAGCIQTGQVSNLDISADTNLAAQSPLSLSDDTMVVANATTTTLGVAMFDPSFFTVANGNVTFSGATGGTDIYYGIINVPNGTNPYVTGANETLNLISSDIVITGTAGNDTVALALGTDSVRDNELAASSDNSGTTVSITDFLSSGPAVNQIPKWDGSNWNPANDTGAAGGTDIYFGIFSVPNGTNPFVTGANETITFISSDIVITGTAGNDTISLALGTDSVKDNELASSSDNSGNTVSIDDFLLGAPAVNQIPKWNGTNWVPGNDTGGGGGNGTDVYWGIVNTPLGSNPFIVGANETLNLMSPDLDITGTAGNDTINFTYGVDSIKDIDVDWGNGTNQINSNDILYEFLAGATYQTLQQWLTVSGSSGIITGGDITENGDGTVDVAAGTGLIRTVNSETSPIVFFDFTGNNSVSLADQNANYIYIDYNAANPVIQVTTSQAILFDVSKTTFAGIFRDGNTTHTQYIGSQIADYSHRNNLRNFEVDGVVRTSGMILTDNGNLTFALTSGVMYQGIDRVTSNAFNTGTGDTFDYWWTDDSGTTWTKVAAQDQIDNTNYNDITSGLTALTAARYAVVWVYMNYDGDDLQAVYGRGDYTSSQAEDAQPPTVLPPVISQFTLLVSKIIIQKSDTTMSIFSPFDTAFTGSFVQNHNDLGGLQGGQAAQYFHLNTAEHTELTAWLDDVTLGASGALTLPSGQNFTIGTDTWNSGDLINMAKASNADLGDIDTAGGVWTVEDDSHEHTGNTVSGISVGNTSLTVGSPLTLTGDLLEIGNATTTALGAAMFDPSFFSVSDGNVTFIGSAVVGNLTDIGDVTITGPVDGEGVYYNGSSWVNEASGSRSVTFVIAAANTTQAGKDRADYVTDGVGDDVQWQAAIDALPSNGGTIIGLEGRYAFDEVLTWAGGNVTLMGVGPATQISLNSYASTPSGFDAAVAFAYVDGANNARITNMSFVKDNVYSANAVIGIGNTTNLEIDHISMQGWVDRGIRASNISIATDVRIHNSYFEDITNSPIWMQGQADVQVYNNRFLNSGDSSTGCLNLGLSVRSQVTGNFLEWTSVATNGIAIDVGRGNGTTVSNNIIYQPNVGIWAGNGGEYTGQVTINANTITGANDDAIDITYGRNITVSNNVIDTVQGEGISIGPDTEHITIIGNAIYKAGLDSSADAISVWGANSDRNYITIIGNTVQNSGDDGILVDAPGGQTLTGITVQGNEVLNSAGDNFQIGWARLVNPSIHGNTGYDFDWGDVSEISGLIEINAGAVTSVEIGNNTILAIDLNATNAEADNDLMTYDSGSGGFTFEEPQEIITAGTNLSWDGTTLNASGGGNGTDIYYGIVDVPTGDDPYITGANQTLTFISDDLVITGYSGNSTVAFEYAADSVKMLIDTIGNFVAHLLEGFGIDITNPSGEGSTPTISVDTTEMGTTTWGDGSAVTHTYDASGGVDPIWTYGANTTNLSTGQLQEDGNRVLTTASTIDISDNTNLAAQSPLSLSDDTMVVANATTTTLGVAMFDPSFFSVANGNVSFTGAAGGTDIYWGVLSVNAGTNPYITSANETLSFISDDIVMTGNSGNDTVAWAIIDDSHLHTGTTLSSIDISDDTNLDVGAPLTLTGDLIEVGNATTTSLGVAMFDPAYFSVALGNVTFIGGGAGDMTKAVYDTDNDGFIDLEAGGLDQSNPDPEQDSAMTWNDTTNRSEWAETYTLSDPNDDRILAWWDDNGNVTMADPDPNQMAFSANMTLTIIPPVISSLPEVVPENSDYLMLWDNTDSALKKIDAEDVIGGGALFGDASVTINYYVSGNGSDSSTGLSPGVAFETIQYAIDQVPDRYQSNYILHIASGNYTKTLSIIGKKAVGNVYMRLQGYQNSTTNSFTHQQMASGTAETGYGNITASGIWPSNSGGQRTNIQDDEADFSSPELRSEDYLLHLTGGTGYSSTMDVLNWYVGFNLVVANDEFPIIGSWNVATPDNTTTYEIIPTNMCTVGNATSEDPMLTMFDTHNVNIRNMHFSGGAADRLWNVSNASSSESDWYSGWYSGRDHWPDNVNPWELSMLGIRLTDIEDGGGTINHRRGSMHYHAIVSKGDINKDESYGIYLDWGKFVLSSSYFTYFNKNIFFGPGFFVMKGIYAQNAEYDVGDNSGNGLASHGGWIDNTENVWLRNGQQLADIRSSGAKLNITGEFWMSGGPIGDQGGGNPCGLTVQFGATVTIADQVGTSTLNSPTGGDAWSSHIRVSYNAAVYNRTGVTIWDADATIDGAVEIEGGQYGTATP